jgi:hypothetical protein
MMTNPAIVNKLVELKYVTAQQAESFTEADIVRAIDGLHQAITIVTKNNETLMAENTEFQAKVKDAQSSEAKKYIELACEAGKLPSKDPGIIQFYMESFIRDPVNTKKVIDALQPNPALKTIVNVTAGNNKPLEKGNIADLIQAQHQVVSEIRAANPGLSFADAFNKARREHPETFPVEA